MIPTTRCSGKGKATETGKICDCQRLRESEGRSDRKLVVVDASFSSLNILRHVHACCMCTYTFCCVLLYSLQRPGDVGYPTLSFFIWIKSSHCTWSWADSQQAPAILLCSLPHDAEALGMHVITPRFLFRFWGFELRPHAYAGSTLIHQSPGKNIA